MTDVTNQGGEPIEFVDDAPAEGVADDQSADQVNDQTEDDADQAEGEGDADEGSQDDDYEDFEEDGKTYKVPKDLKGHLLRNRDYTQKTQELGNARRQFEARVSAFDTATKEYEDTHFEAASVQRRLSDLQELSDADWQELARRDQINGTRDYDRLHREFTALPAKLAGLKGTLEAKAGEAAKAKQEISVTRQRDAEAILQRDISGWNPETATRLASFVQDNYGVSVEKQNTAEFDAALVKMARDAQRYHDLQRKTATQKKAEDVSKNPPPKLAKRAAPVNGLDESLSAAEWAKRRNAQVAKRYT